MTDRWQSVHRAARADGRGLRALAAIADRLVFLAAAKLGLATSINGERDGT